MILNLITIHFIDKQPHQTRENSHGREAISVSPLHKKVRIRLQPQVTYASPQQLGK
jgi:hypothetical protein